MKNVKSEIIHVAAALARGDFLPSGNFEDWLELLPKSTPKAAVREITLQSSNAADECRLIAIRLRHVADSLSSLD